ncbi:MAG: hypothetical protein WA364_29310 [Candidatus Nitrosopolaris sp.]
MIVKRTHYLNDDLDMVLKLRTVKNRLPEHFYEPLTSSYLRVKHTIGRVYFFGTVLKEELVDFMFSVIPSDSKYNLIKPCSKGRQHVVFLEKF